MNSGADKEHIIKLFEKYYESLSKIAFCYLRSIHDAQDVAEEVFLKYIEACPEFESEEHEKAWLIRVAVNKCKDRLKRSKYIPPEPEYFSAPSTESVEILDAVMSLPEKYRLAVHMFYYEDMSAAEIASVIGISETAVTTRLSRARRLLERRI